MYSPHFFPTPTDRGIISPLHPEYHWYAIYTRSRFEKKVFQELQRSNFQVFLPLIKEKKQWSDRIKTVNVPLIPGYVFIKLDRQSIPRLNYYAGVVRIVSFDRKPCEVREEEVQLLESIISHSLSVEIISTCGIGDHVRIVRGPLEGWIGRVETRKGKSRIVLQIDSIRQCISVEVNQGDLERVN